MAIIQPFRALRPTPESAARVAAVPYDVVSTDEARALAADEPLSFLHVSRAEIDLPGVDPHADVVYEGAARRFRQLRQDAPLVPESEPGLYAYRLVAGEHAQVGIAAGFSIDEYDRDLIRKHERTRQDKEDDRTRHITALRAQTGPVFLTYRASSGIDSVVSEATTGVPLFDFEAVDGVRHTIWRLTESETQGLVDAFAQVPALYIADGHHRAASAARARRLLRDETPADPSGRSSAAGALPCDLFLAVAFPDDQVRILAYNRALSDLNGLTPGAFLDAVGREFDVRSGEPVSSLRGTISMYLQGRWHALRPRAHSGGSAVAPAGVPVTASLDVSVLQARLLEPILGVRDVRTDPRIEFVGGGRGTAALESRVDGGIAAVAFSMYPVSVADLMAVSDAGEIMPPKSTWFEPKLRDGLLIHEI